MQRKQAQNLQNEIQVLEIEIKKEQQKLADLLEQKKEYFKLEQELRAVYAGLEKALKQSHFWMNAQEWWHSQPPSEAHKKCKSDLEKLPAELKKSIERENAIKENFDKITRQQEAVISSLKEEFTQKQADRLLNIIQSEINQSAATNRFTHFNKTVSKIITTENSLRHEDASPVVTRSYR